MWENGGNKTILFIRYMVIAPTAAQYHDKQAAMELFLLKLKISAL